MYILDNEEQKLIECNRIRDKIVHEKQIYITTEERYGRENIVVSKKHS